MAVGGTLAGAQAAVGSISSDGAIPLLEDMRNIAAENEKNTENMFNVFLDMFAFDKERYARERDQLREQRKEALKQKGEGLKIPEKDDFDYDNIPDWEEIGEDKPKKAKAIFPDIEDDDGLGGLLDGLDDDEEEPEDDDDDDWDWDDDGEW